MYLKLILTYLRAKWKSLLLHSNIHPRYKFTLWLLAQNRLATVLERLLKIGIQVPSACAFRGHSPESFSHLFFDCIITIQLWCRLCLWMGYNRNVGDWNAELQWACKKAKSKSGTNVIANCVFAMAVALIWRERNKVKFEHTNFDASSICMEIVLH